MIKSTYLFALFLVLCPFAFSQNARTSLTLTETKVTTQSYIDKEVIIPGKTELHLTALSSPLKNSIINLNSEDAWLIIDNIRPQVIVDSVLQYVYVNGQKAVEKSNVRISIYKQGTVIIAQSPSYQPLIVYTDQNYGGNSQKYSMHTFYNALGGYDNKIRSFKLKRGYMATLATAADGTGYSRCFIADDADLEVPILSGFLDQKISFIRVLDWEYVSKKGWCGWGESDYKLANATWHYDWNAGGNTDHLTEYVPIHQMADWPGWDVINPKTYVSHVLGFNEPDHTDQSNMTFQQMIDRWPDFMKSGLRIGSPAWASPWGGNGGTLFDFIHKCDQLNYRVDFVALHCYWGGLTPKQWYDNLKYIHDLTGRPLWITEWNNGANWTTESWPDATGTLTTANAQKQLDDLKGILQVLDTASFVERYSIYNWVEDRRAIILNGQLTPAGEYYASNNAPFAFNRKAEVIPGFTYISTPALSLTASGTTKINLVVTDPGFEQTLGCIIEKKIDNGNYQTLFDSNTFSVTNFSDTLDINAGSTVYYRMRTKLAGGIFSSYSNEASYNITSGTDIQFGNLSSSSIDWSPVIFKQPISSPVIVTGAPTNKNATILMSNRVKYASSKQFNFQLSPWKYQGITSSLPKIESVSYLCANTGTYDLGGLKAIAARVTGVNSTWKDIAFSTAFDTIPVVLVNQFTPTTSFATTVRVRNVTKTGFQVKLQKESAVTTALTGETVSYIAIAQGRGNFNNNQIIVSKTANTVGPLYYTTINYGDSVSNAIFIPQIQTCNDDTVTATLRCVAVGTKSSSVIKQREKSLGLTTAANETVGWVLIKPASVIQGIEIPRIESMEIYPNPVIETLYFKQFQDNENIRIYNLLGTLVKMINVTGNQIDVADLPVGYYVIKAGINKTTKFFKQ